MARAHERFDDGNASEAVRQQVELGLRGVNDLDDEVLAALVRRESDFDGAGGRQRGGVGGLVRIDGLVDDRLGLAGLDDRGGEHRGHGDRCN